MRGNVHYTMTHPLSKPDVVAEQFSDPGHSREDLRLIRRAARNRWPVSPEMQARVVEKCSESLDAEDPRLTMRAIEALTEMVNTNARIDMADDAADVDVTRPKNQTTVLIIQPPTRPRDDVKLPLTPGESSGG